MAGRPRDLGLERDWRRHIKQQRASGVSVREYCFEHGLSEPSFYVWRRRIGERDQATAGSPAFVPVVITGGASRSAEAPIEIRLANGRRIRVRAACDRALLADVLTILEGRSC